MQSFDETVWLRNLTTVAVGSLAMWSWLTCAQLQGWGGLAMACASLPGSASVVSTGASRGSTRGVAPQLCVQVGTQIHWLT